MEKGHDMIADYLRGQIDRRGLLKTGLAAAGACVISRMFSSPRIAAAALMPQQDTGPENVDAETIHYPLEDLQLDAYVAKTKGDSKYPAVLVIHDNRGGLNGSIRDVTKRFAGEGFVAMAPDILSRTGGVGKLKPNEVTAAINRIPIDQGLEDLTAAIEFLKKDSSVDPRKISSVGFGWGGWRSFALASKVPDLYRAVVFYGSTPVNGLEDVRAPIMANYAQFDFRNTGNAIPTENEMKEMGKKFIYYDYPNTYSGFFLPGPRFDDDAAKLAWTRTIDFLRS